MSRMCFRYVCIFVMGVLALAGCKGGPEEDEIFYSTGISVSDVTVDEHFCFPDDQVTCSFRITNPTDYMVSIREVKVIVKRMTGDVGVIGEKVVAGASLLAPGEYVGVDAVPVFKASAGKSGFCSMYVVVTFEGGSTSETFLSYMRIIESNSLVTYNISRTEYQGLPIYRLNGDMSAGFGVLKALTAMDCAMSPTYDMIPSGSGPYAVIPTKEFLQRSVRYTTELYNNIAGATGKIKRVVIGTGIASLSYFATTMGAAYLPLHYLVSANAVSEIKDILDFSNENGYPSYATLGYDGSMPGAGVAWIKLLDLPEEYCRFIADHQVEEVYIYGVGQAGIGESYARKVLYEGAPEEDYAPGQLYILYTNYGSDSDVAALKSRLYDYGSTRLAPAGFISDWESGITDGQIENISESVKDIPDVKAYTVATDDMMDLYDLATHLSLQYLARNRSFSDGPDVNGIIMNEYLTNHPQYEVFKGYVPLLYWQGNPASSTVGRIDSDVKTAVSYYSADLAENIYAGSFYLNSYSKRESLKSELLGRGVQEGKIRIRQAADQWNPSDDSEMDPSTLQKRIGSAEEFSYDIIENIGVENYRNTVKSWEYLTTDELRDICTRFNGMSLIEN